MSIFYYSGYAAIFGVVTNLGSNVYKLGDFRVRELLNWSYLISVIKNGPLSWLFKRATQTVNLATMICFHSLWPQTGHFLRLKTSS